MACCATSPRGCASVAIPRASCWIARGAPDCTQWYGERTFLFFTLGVANWLAGRRLPILGVDYKAGA